MRIYLGRRNHAIEIGLYIKIGSCNQQAWMGGGDFSPTKDPGPSYFSKLIHKTESTFWGFDERKDTAGWVLHNNIGPDKFCWSFHNLSIKFLGCDHSLCIVLSCDLSCTSVGKYWRLQRFCVSMKLMQVRGSLRHNHVRDNTPFSGPCHDLSALTDVVASSLPTSRRKDLQLSRGCGWPCKFGKGQNMQENRWNVATTAASRFASGRFRLQSLHRPKV